MPFKIQQINGYINLKVLISGNKFNPHDSLKTECGI